MGRKNRIYRLGLASLVAVLCVGCDQATKAIARDVLGPSPPRSLLNGFVHLEYTENSGAFMGLGSSLPDRSRFLLWVVFTSVALSFLLAIIFRAAVRVRSLSVHQLAGLSLLLGGGIGNLIDRLSNAGAVVDFVSLGIGPLRTGIFNVADFVIIAGSLVFLAFSTRDRYGSGQLDATKTDPVLHQR